MTNPNHTDTSRSGDLVERLLEKADTVAATNHSEWFLYTQAADRITTQARENERLREALQWMVDNDETNEGDEPMEDFGGQSWNEINAYWIEGLNRARAALGEKQ